jgi:hypothetical protein
MHSSAIFTRNNVGVFVLSVSLFILVFFRLGIPIPEVLQSVELVVFYYLMLSSIFGYLTRRFITLSAVPAFILVLLVPLSSYGIVLMTDILVDQEIRFEKPLFGITIMVVQLIFVILGACISQIRLKNVSMRRMC